MQKRIEFTREMKRASSNLEFEKAAVLRDRLGALQQVTERNAIVLSDGTDADVIAWAADELEIAFHVFHVRAGRVRGQRGVVAAAGMDRGRAAGGLRPGRAERFLARRTRGCLRPARSCRHHGGRVARAGHAARAGF